MKKGFLKEKDECSIEEQQGRAGEGLVFGVIFSGNVVTETGCSQADAMGIHRRQCCCRANIGNDTQEHSEAMVSTVEIVVANQVVTKKPKLRALSCQVAQRRKEAGDGRAGGSGSEVCRGVGVAVELLLSCSMVAVMLRCCVRAAVQFFVLVLLLVPSHVQQSLLAFLFHAAPSCRVV